MEKEKIIVAATGASGMPILKKCLELLRADGKYEIGLILSDSAKLTMEYELSLNSVTKEMDETTEATKQIESLADEIYDLQAVGAAPASGSYKVKGMLIVPCSMKTIAGIHSGYADNLILRTADVQIKEHRPLVLAARETPLSAIHLRNMQELAMLPEVRIIPPMLTFYQQPETIDDMVYHIAAKLLEPFGIEAKEYRRWKG